MYTFQNELEKVIHMRHRKCSFLFHSKTIELCKQVVIQAQVRVFEFSDTYTREEEKR